jgi:hypothetical protein
VLVVVRELVEDKKNVAVADPLRCLIRLVGTDDCTVCTTDTGKHAVQAIVEADPAVKDRKGDLSAQSLAERVRRSTSPFDEGPRDVVKAAPIVVGNVAHRKPPFDGERIDARDEDINPVVLRVVTAPEADVTLSVGIESPSSEVGLESFRVTYGPAPLEPGAFQEFGIVAHER